MSDEDEESMSEGFSASEDEWKPSTDKRGGGGESSDDDDSDFEEVPIGGAASFTASSANARKREPKSRSATKQAAASKKRKPTGQSLRSKLYNKYRPPPKTFPSPSSMTGKNSPSASTSGTASKNFRTPNESSKSHNNDDSSSDSSVEDHLVNPADLDLQSSFFNIGSGKAAASAGTSPVPVFDCNAGITNFSDSGSEDNNESSAEERSKTKAFDFRNLLENAQSLERTKEAIAKRAAANLKNQESTAATTNDIKTETMDVNSLLALGEKQHGNYSSSLMTNNVMMADEQEETMLGPQKLSKTKSTRVKKRHTKTRPTSTIMAAADSDDSDWEEVADVIDAELTDHDDTNGHTTGHNESLEIHVEMPTKQRGKKRTQDELELAFKRKLNRDLKLNQLQLHKTSLLCWFARSYRYNRMLNDTALMQHALKLLPSTNSYPPERGTELKYYQSLVTWFRTAIKLKNDDLYPPPSKKPMTWESIQNDLLQQMQRKEAHCKQDMIFIFVILLRGMGLQCRLIVNMQPLPLRPSQADLLKIKLKRNDKEAKAPTKSSTSNDDKPDVKAKEKVKNEKKIDEKPNSKKEAEKGEHDKSKEVEKSRRKDTVKPSNVKTTEVAHLEKNNKEKSTKNRCMEVSDKMSKVEKRESEKSRVAAKSRTKDSASTSKEHLTDIQHLEEDVENKKPIAEASVNLREKPTLSRLKRLQLPKAAKEVEAKKPKLPSTEAEDSRQFTPIARRTRKTSSDKANSSTRPIIEIGSPVIPKLIVESSKGNCNALRKTANKANTMSDREIRSRSRSKSPKIHISPQFLQSVAYKEKLQPNLAALGKPAAKRRVSPKQPNDNKVKISVDFLKDAGHTTAKPRVLRSTHKPTEAQANEKTSSSTTLQVPQLDGADDLIDDNCKKSEKQPNKRRPQLKKLQKQRSEDADVSDSDEDFEPSPTKRPKKAPNLTAKAKDRRILSTDDEMSSASPHKEEMGSKRNKTAADMWIEVWSDMEEQWICIDLFKGKLHSVESIRKSASSSFAYVFAFQNDLSIKDVTARYCPNWTTTVRKARVEKAWLDTALSSYCGQRTKRDIRENQELRRIHEEKPMPTTISEYKDHPLYALERHLLKFQALYPPDAPTLGFVRGEAVYSRDCVHTLHSRDIWLKQARTVKLGEQPYKIVKARPKWDRLTQTVIKDQPLEIFGYWQTQDYEPPTAENGVVPRNAYGNVELFKECMLPKKTVHLRLSGLNRICKKLGIDCANAVVGFDFHQGACHPMYDGFVVCEEFGDQVTAAWYQDQEEQERKEQEKYETRVYRNWKKLINGLLIRERLKKKYNF